MTEDGPARLRAQAEPGGVHCPGCNGYGQDWVSECRGVDVPPAPPQPSFRFGWLRRWLEASGLFRP